MMWLIFPTDDDGDQHVVPHADLHEHELGQSCWCRPRRDAEVPSVLIHSAMDQREKYETGELRLQ